MGTVVCAVEETAEAMEALRVAAHLSSEAGLRLVAVHVEEVTGAEPRLRRSAEEHGRRLLERVLAGQRLDGVDRRVEVGEPARELARVAAEERASVIVVGAGRHRWWQRGPSRGVTAELAATSPAPVVVAPAAMPR